jgi:pimeloyl-ACP methyl ester carboxylesterase
LEFLLELDIVFHKGNADKPLIIFVHGLGMDANFWANPSGARILGGKYPLRLLIPDMEMKNSFEDLYALGFPVLTWSQNRPAAEAMVAFAELTEIMDALVRGPVILIGHSRGGLLARMLAERNIDKIVAVITIGSPHHGSTIAKWADHLSPLASTLNKLLDTGKKDKKGSPVQKILAFLGSAGLREMLPDSEFIRSLASGNLSGITAISIGGTDPSIIQLNGKTFLAALSGILPNNMMPDELREGMGDGMVSAASSVWPGASEHRNYYAHHASLPFNDKVRDYIIKIVSAHG